MGEDVEIADTRTPEATWKATSASVKALVEHLAGKVEHLDKQISEHLLQAILIFSSVLSLDYSDEISKITHQVKEQYGRSQASKEA